MKFYGTLLYFLIFLGFASKACCVPLEDLQNLEELIQETSPANQLPDTASKTMDKSLPDSSKTSEGVIFSSSSFQQIPTNGEQGKVSTAKDKPVIGIDDSDFYLFEQEELDKEKSGLGLYESLSPMLAPEMKKDIKKVWTEAAEFREALELSTEESSNKELVLKKSSKKMTLLKGQPLNAVSAEKSAYNLPDKKEPNQEMVRKLFDDFFDLFKKVFLIIVTIIILTKSISWIMTRFVHQKQKHNHIKKKRYRKKRRRTYA